MNGNFCTLYIARQGLGFCPLVAMVSIPKRDRLANWGSEKYKENDFVAIVKTVGTV